ncbi:hypothetical protein ACVFI8_14835 [Agarivorans sp. MS3-6]
MFQLLLILFGSVALYYYRRDSNERVWLRLPTFEDYLRNSLQQAENGAQHACIYCHSDQTWEYGLASLMDYRRECVCLGCGHRLWRKEQQSLPL